MNSQDRGGARTLSSRAQRSLRAVGKRHPGIRTKIVLVFVGVLALGTLASVLVAREVLYSRLDERIDDELTQEVSELRRLASSTNPSTGRPFGSNVRSVFRAYFERNTPSRGEVLLTFVDGSPFLRSRRVESYRLDEDRRLIRHWGSIVKPERGSTETPAGEVDFLAVPLTSGNETLGVFVVAQFREQQQGPFDDAIAATAAVGLAVLLIGSLLAWFMAENLLRPVRSVTHAALGISETDLTQRIEVRGTDELAELAQTFNAMLDRLEEAFVSQRRFLDDAGHELRTPITIIRGHLELLEEDPEERAITLELVMDELERMSRMVDDLLLLAKAEQPHFLHLEDVDIGVLSAELHAKAAALAPRSWSFDLRSSGSLTGDRHRLTQALMQLAENAVAQTRDGDPIELGCSLLDGEARFWVRDQGPGIAPADRTAIFERFQRRGDRRKAGAGLGLSIVRVIAEAHGGRVELSSSPGAGATFTIVVPAGGPTHGQEATTT